MKDISIIFIVCFFLACDNKTKLGQYVYEDDMEVFHTDDNCPKLKDGTEYEFEQIWSEQKVFTE